MRAVTWLVLLALCLVPSSGTGAPHARPIVVVAANQSFNWAGYVQGALEKGTTFHSIAATWVVPTASPHRAGENEYSSSWIGIGGGCLDTACTLTDATLIQAGIGLLGTTSLPEAETAAAAGRPAAAAGRALQTT